MAGDIFYNSVSLLLHGDGADLSTTITDNSPSVKTMTPVSGAKISTAQSLFGGASILLNGSSDYVTTPTNTGYEFGTGDFTIETSFRLTGYSSSYSGSYGAALVSNYQAGGANTGWQLRVNGLVGAWNTINFFTGLTDLNVTGLTLALNTTYRVAVTRSGTTLRVFLDGALVGTFTNSDSLTRSTPAPLYVGKLNDATFQFFMPGYLDEMRITKGVARYTAAYTLATAAFPDVVEIALMQAPLVAPSPLLSLNFGSRFALTAPAPAVALFTGPQVVLTAPSPQLAAVFGSNIYLTAPRPTLQMAMHDATGENEFSFTAPSPSLVMRGGAAIDMGAPSPALAMSMTGTSLLTARLTAPMPQVVLSGTTSGTMQVVATAPMATLVGYGGAVISVTGPMGTLVASGTGGGLVEFAMTCPLFDLQASITAQGHVEFDLLVPMPQMGQGSLVAWMFAPMAQLVLIGTATVAATYEAYALNLKHQDDGPDQLTRYTNYPFDYIVRYANSYYGVHSSGVYLLEGTTDFASPTPLAITWDWRTCITDFGRENKKTPNAVYIGGRMAAAATITLGVGETGDQTYSFTTPRGAIAQDYRQKFGNGLKQNYYSLGASGAGELAVDYLHFLLTDLPRRI